MKKAEHEKKKKKKKIATVKYGKKCTRITHYSAPTENGPSVVGPFYTGVEKSMF